MVKRLARLLPEGEAVDAAGAFEARFIRILAKDSKRTFVLQSVNGRLAFMVPGAIAIHYETFGYFAKFVKTFTPTGTTGKGS